MGNTSCRNPVLLYDCHPCFALFEVPVKDRHNDGFHIFGWYGVPEMPVDFYRIFVPTQQDWGSGKARRLRGFL
jgi:hypothetical protein